jgi:hypothetical protein
MEENNAEWGDVTIPEKVEYEIEEDTPSVEKTEQPEVKAEAPKKEEIKELDGIETNGAQKRIRQLVKQRKEREEQIEALLREKQELQERLLSQEQSFVDTQKTTTSMSEQQLNDKVALAKAAYLDAYNSGDGEKVLQTLEVLQRSQLDLDNLSKQKAALDNYTKAKEEEEAKKEAAQPQQPVQRTADPRAEEWAAENEWFGKDNVMTASALAIDAELKQMGYNPDEEDFYTEIDRRLRAEFPHKFTNQEVSEDNRPQQTTPAAQVVAGASRSPATSSKKIKLSQEDVRLANKWNIPLEVYAAEKLKVDSSEGDYTDITFGRGS